MDERIRSVTEDLSQVAADARAMFGHLSPEQLNWKPAKDSWSVAQCFEHIIRTNLQFYPEFEKMAAGTRQNSFWENWSPLSGWGGRFLINAVTIDSKKAKAPSKDIVPPSQVDGDIIDRFAKHIEDVNRMVEACESVDRQKTVVTSPFLAVFTYRLDDAFTVLVEHTRRHFRQAARVAGADGFPG